MITSEFTTIRDELKKVLKESRFEHSLGVAYTAASLAMCHGISVEDCLLAGILHDCAKNLSDEDILNECEKNNLPISDVERRSPFLLHAKLGAFYAKEKYGVSNESILNAITFHTTGRPDMSTLEKIIFISDYIEPTRKDLDNMEDARRLAFSDLDKCIVCILDGVLIYLKENSREIDTKSFETYEYYKKLKEQ